MAALLLHNIFEVPLQHTFDILVHFFQYYTFFEVPSTAPFRVGQEPHYNTDFGVHSEIIFITELVLQ